VFINTGVCLLCTLDGFPTSCCCGCGGRGVGVESTGKTEVWSCSGRCAAICMRIFSSVSHLMCTVRHCPLWHPGHCPMGTVPRVLMWRTASPAYADFDGLSSGAPPVVIRLDVVSLQSRSSTPMVAGCQLGGNPAGRDQWGGKRAAGGMSEDHDRCFSILVLGAFSTGVFQTPMYYPALTLTPTCGANQTC
jgi:hypothetical protein